MKESQGQLSAADGINAIAYQQQSAGTAHFPTVVFIHGFRSDMMGSKAEHLAQFCAHHQIGFLRFNLRGHGPEATAPYTDFTIGDWVNDALKVIDELTTGPLILVGSSLGGWLMLHAAQKRSQRVQAIIGIAPAPDFVTEFIEPAMKPEHHAQVASLGYLETPFGYPDRNRFTKAFLADGQVQRVLHQPIKFDGPVRILQGMQDAEVPWQHALKIQAQLTSHDVEVKLFKDGDHRLSTTAQLEELSRTLGVLLGLKV